MNPADRNELTVRQAAQIGDALLPRFREAMRDDVDRLHNGLADVKAEIAGLKARSGLWGGVGGVLTALGAILLGKLR